MLKELSSSLWITAIGLVVAYLWGGVSAVVITAILVVLEVSLSFDNAVVNAAVLKRMDAVWQRRFLTWGIAIAVFGVRFVFPLVIVAVTASLAPWTALDLAINNATEYARHLTEAHAAISSFGAMFLLMVFLKFLLNDEKEIHWIGVLERQLSRLGKLESIEIIFALSVLVLFASLGAGDEAATVLIAGIWGLVAYIATDSMTSYLEKRESAMASLATNVPAQAGLSLFIYLQLLDASFSLDGVVGAFAVSKDIVVIALGLGVGAFFVRSLTLVLVRRGTLSEYVYLEHGAHYAIGALAALMLGSIVVHIPEAITGTIGAGVIALSLISSIRHRRTHQSGN